MTKHRSEHVTRRTEPGGLRTTGTPVEGAARWSGRHCPTMSTDGGGGNVDNPVSAESFEQDPEMKVPAAAGAGDEMDKSAQIARMTFARFGTTPTNWQYVYFPVCCLA